MNVYSLLLKWPTAKPSDLIYSPLIQSDEARKEVHTTHAFNEMTIISAVVGLKGSKQWGHSKLAWDDSLEIWFDYSLVLCYPMPSKIATSLFRAFKLFFWHCLLSFSEQHPVVLVPQSCWGTNLPHERGFNGCPPSLFFAHTSKIYLSLRVSCQLEQPFYWKNIKETRI